MASTATASTTANGTNTTASLSERVPTYHNVPDAQYTLPNESALPIPIPIPQCPSPHTPASTSTHPPPPSAPEHLRLETQASHLSAIMHNRIVHAPLAPSPSRILDVGCGTGIVTTHLAQLYPSATVYGLDLSPVPAQHPRPPNVRFIQGDILQTPVRETDDLDLDLDLAATASTTDNTTALPPSTFTYLFSRLLICGMSNWPRYLRTAHQLLAPGGWAELHDLDWVWYDGAGHVISGEWEWLRVLRAAARGRGLDFECGSRVAGWMGEAGFVHVRRHEYRWPFGGECEDRPEMRAFGQYVASAMPDLFHHAIPKLLEGRGYTEEQVEGWRAAMRRDFRSERGKHWVFYVTVGRKAGEGEGEGK